MLRKIFPDSPFYNLLLSDQFFRISARPQVIREELQASKDSINGPVIIDEIQKLPLLLDEIHNLIESYGFTFILTGSSPRKLRREGINLLGGRARTKYLFPFVSEEIPDFDLYRALTFGTIPSVYLSDEPEEDLISYCGNYLQQEIQAECAVRNIENFSRFLVVAALSNGTLLNIENISRDAEVRSRTVHEYFSILEETLIGVRLPPYKRTLHRKPIATPKFYFFDIGVANALKGIWSISEKPELLGNCFEHFIFCELRAYLSYAGDRRPLCFWRSRDGSEVDFIIDDAIAIEVKATRKVYEKHLKGLRRFSEEVPLKKKIVVSFDPTPRKMDTIEVLPWNEFLKRLWGGEYQ